MIRRGLVSTPLGGPQGGIVEFVRPSQHATMTPGGAMTGGQLVKLSANRTVIISAALADRAIGVALYNAAATDTQVTVATYGVYPLTASGTIAFGDDLLATTAGAAITLAAAAAAAAADINNARAIIGRAWEGAASTAQFRGKLML